MSQTEVARRFNLSPSRVNLIEKQDAETRAMEGRRARMIKQLQDANDMDKLWPVEDLLDALGLIVVTRKRLVDHFAEKRQDQISLRELMDMCLDAPVAWAPERRFAANWCHHIPGYLPPGLRRHGLPRAAPAHRDGWRRR
jgi:hypothetical protein